LTLILDSIGITSQETQTLINGILTIWNLVTSLGFALLVNKFKRRTMFLTSTVCMLVCFIVWTALESTFEKQVDNSGSGSPAVGRAILALIFLYNAAFNIAWAPLQVTYVVEILPYRMRARVSFLIKRTDLQLRSNRVLCYTTFLSLSHSSSISTRIPSPSRASNGNVRISASYHCLDISNDTNAISDYIVYDVWLFVELLVVYLLFVETSGSSLEEMAAIIDGEEVRDTIIEAVARVTDGKAVDQREDVMDDKRPHVAVA
jgi:hypothetical protein